MLRLPRVMKLAATAGLLLAISPAIAGAQRPPAQPLEWTARRAIGVRLGSWNVDVLSIAEPVATPQFELFLQRSLDAGLAIENSVGLYRITTTEQQALPPTEDVEVDSYVIPLLISLKFYPFSDASPRLAPFIQGGAGLAFGIEDEGDNAIGGGGTAVATGFGIRAAAGAELRVVGGLGVSAAARYQWLHFGVAVGGADTYHGVGWEGGVTYRFRY
jgi:hypothetical protein